MMRLRDWKAAHDDVPGWFSDMAAGLCDAFLDFQSVRGVAGDMLEIGVAHGRSALLFNLHTRGSETFYAVDLLPSWLTQACARLRMQGTGRVLSFCGDSKYFAPEYIQAGSVRFAHIDADHGRAALHVDLRIADHALADDGLLVLDDFLAPQYLAATAGVFEWLTLHPGRFEMILAGHNKAFLTRPGGALPYLRFVRDAMPAAMRARGTTDFTFWRMSSREDWRGFGVAGRQWDRDFVGLREKIEEPEGPPAQRFPLD
jgi:hypothetical protein